MNRRLAIDVTRFGIGPGLEEQREGDPEILFGGKVQRGLAKVRGDIHLGSVIEQPLDRLRPSVARGPVERRPELVALAVDVGVVVEQQLHRRELAVPSGVVQGRVAVPVAGVGFIVPGQQHGQPVNVALGRRCPDVGRLGFLREQGSRCGDEKDATADD